MSVWVTVPSKRSVDQVKPWMKAWKDQGYKVALWREDDEFSNAADLHIIGGEYPGYAQATNTLIRCAIEDYGAHWCVIGGDDVWPDTTKRADEIAQECEEHFGGTLGICQPTADRWGESPQSIDQYGPEHAAYIDRIAGSAWIGREAALRLYGGNGPLWSGYPHMFSDQELCEVAEKLGIYWRRRELCHLHKHWSREPGKTREDCPEFLREVAGQDHWNKYKAIYEERARLGFPGHELSA